MKKNKLLDSGWAALFLDPVTKPNLINSKSDLRGKDKNCLNGEVHDYSQVNHFFPPGMIPNIAPRINGRDFLKKQF